QSPKVSESQELLQSVFDTSLIRISILQAVYDHEGNISDFRIKLVNKELEKETGRTDLAGKLYSQEYPGIRQTGLYQLMLQVMETGEAGQIEYYYPHEGFNKWYSCMFIKMGDGLLATNLDVTERRQSEEMVKSSEQRLRMFVTASSDLIFQMDADWTEMLVLKSDVVLVGTKSPVIQWIQQFIPDEERQIFKDAIENAKLNRKMFELEHKMYLPDGEIGWSNTRAIPLLDEEGNIVEWFGVATDITDKKKFEQERNRSYLLLPQAEAVAGTGTWHYDIIANKVSWSDGMYDLFSQGKDQPIGLDIYEKYAIAECKDRAIEIVNQISAGNSVSEELLKVHINNKIKEIKINAMVIFTMVNLSVF
ncbi:MAG: PAS domain-containing protein, partial [Pedobacter sp.]